jgi:small-conductance mechanosensitive channel
MPDPGWTIETLRAYFERVLVEKDLRDEQRFNASQQALSAAMAANKELVSAALTSAEKAVQKAETANERRFESVNEFRQTLTDQTKEFPTKAVVDGQMSAIREQVSALTGRMDRQDGTKSGWHDGGALLMTVISIAIGIGGVVVAVISYLHH